MSISENKASVASKISAYVSFSRKKTKRRSSYNFNESKDSLKFMVDLLSTFMGRDAIKIILGNVLSKYIRSAEPSFKGRVKNQLSSIASDQKVGNTTFDVKVSDIDTDGLYKTNPNSDEGKLLYGSSTSFNSKVANAMTAPGTAVSYNGYDITYNKSVNTLTFNTQNPDQTIGEFFSNTVDSSDLLNEKVIVSRALDSIFGTVSKKSSRDAQTIYNNILIEKYLEHTLSNDDTDLNIDYADIEYAANLLMNGTSLIDSDCGMVELSPSFDSLLDTVNLLLNSENYTNSMDALDNFYQSTNIESCCSNTNLTQSVSDSKNKSFLEKIRTIILKLLYLSPEMIVLRHFKDMFTIGSITPGINIENIISNEQNNVKCLSDDVNKGVNKFVYNLVINELKKIATNIGYIIAEEKIKKTRNIIKSLVKLNL